MLLLGLVAACGAKTPPPPTETPGSPSAVPVTCTRDADCGAGEMCHGAQGCDVPWTCGAPRPCTKDLVFYCGCDGKDHQGSGTCPPAPYAHKGRCP